MATTDNELKTLNKNVLEALNILKVYVGSSAQVKAMNEQQRATIAKWFEVTEQAEDIQKKQRAFTERQRDASGKFISKQDKSVNNFMNMAKTVGNLFSKTTEVMKTSIGNFASNISSHFTNFFRAVKSQFLSLFGEESEWFEILGSIKDSVKGFSESIFRFIFKKTPSWAGKQIKVLKDIYKLQLKQMKMDFLDIGGGKKKKKGILGLLTTILIGIAIGIGAWLHRYLFLITKLPIFSKVAKLFTVIEDIPFIGKLFKAVKFGFKWLGWPLTLLISIINFIKGFSATEGTLWEKVKGGLWEVVKGFIEMPIRFIGWVIEKVAGLFGVEIDHVADKMIKIVKKGFFMVFEGWEMLFSLMRDGIDIAVNTVIGKIKQWKDPLFDAISPIITGIQNYFTEFWNSAVDWMITKIPSWLPGSESIAEGLKGIRFSQPTTPESVAGTVSDHEKRRLESKKKSDKELKESIDKMHEDIKDGNKKTGDAINAVSNTQGNNINSGGEVKQIPDEIDNNFVSLQNYSGAF